MTENMKKLLELASNNPEFQEKIRNATRENLIALAKEAGIALTDADFEVSVGEVSDNELDAVTGGKYCYCAIGGGGSSEYSKTIQSKTCVCVGGGGGETGSGATRCVCVFGGQGVDIQSKPY